MKLAKCFYSLNTHSLYTLLNIFTELHMVEVYQFKFPNDKQLISIKFSKCIEFEIKFSNFNNRMMIRRMFVTLLLVSVAFTAILTTTNGAFTTILPANCLEVNLQSMCTSCAPNYVLQNGACILSSGVPAPPCGQLNSCGQAVNFKTLTQYQKFINSNLPKITTTQTATSSDPKAKDSNLQQAKISTYTPTSSASSLITNGSITPTPTPQPTPDPNLNYTSTNNQVKGVDEADLIKTDGTYIYTVSNQILSILLAYPFDRSRVLSQINLKQFIASDLFVHGDILAVFGVKWKAASSLNQILTGSLSSLQLRPETYLRVYNLSNRVYPILQKQLIFSGQYFSARKLPNGYMYLLTKSTIQSSDQLPWYNFDTKTQLTPQQIFHYPGTYTKLVSTNIISLSLVQPTINNFKIISICGEQPIAIYMTQYFLYLAYGQNNNGVQYTVFRKVFVFENIIQPFADAKVNGKVGNQFFMDQNNDFLRVFTSGVNQNNVTTNNVYVFDYGLRVIGKLTNFAIGQTITSGRFYGSRLYLALNRSVDPFLVVSLRNYYRISVIGYVKMTGFLNYLQLFNQQTLVCLGRQSDANGTALGLKISVINVTDVRNPKQSASFTLNTQYSGSTALLTHKALLLLPQKNLLIIPAFLQTQQDQVNGAFILNINPSKIQLKAVANHIVSPDDDFSKRYVERSIVIQDNIYTKSKCLIRINKIADDFKGVRNINVPCTPKIQDLGTDLPIPSDTGSVGGLTTGVAL